MIFPDYPSLSRPESLNPRLNGLKEADVSSADSGNDRFILGQRIRGEKSNGDPDDPSIDHGLFDYRIYRRRNSGQKFSLTGSGSPCIRTPIENPKRS